MGEIWPCWLFADTSLDRPLKTPHCLIILVNYIIFRPYTWPCVPWHPRTPNYTVQYISKTKYSIRYISFTPISRYPSLPLVIDSISCPSWFLGFLSSWSVISYSISEPRLRSHQWYTTLHHTTTRTRHQIPSLLEHTRLDLDDTFQVIFTTVISPYIFDLDIILERISISGTSWRRWKHREIE